MTEPTTIPTEPTDRDNTPVTSTTPVTPPADETTKKTSEAASPADGSTADGTATVDGPAPEPVDEGDEPGPTPLPAPLNNRTRLAQVLRPHLPQIWDILPYHDQESQVVVPTVMIAQKHVIPGLNSIRDTIELDLLLVDAVIDRPLVDDELESKLDHVLNIFTMMVGDVAATLARRVTTKAGQPAYELLVTLGATRDRSRVA